MTGEIRNKSCYLVSMGLLHELSITYGLQDLMATRPQRSGWRRVVPSWHNTLYNP